MRIGERVKGLRLEARLNQTELATKLGITRFSVTNWESGRRYPSLKVLNDIAVLFNVTTDFLLENNEPDTVENWLAKGKDIFQDPQINAQEKMLILEKVMKMFVEKENKKPQRVVQSRQESK